MSEKFLFALVTALVVLVALLVSGCTTTPGADNQTANQTLTPTVNPHLKMKPEQVVSSFWKDMDNGSFVDAYDLAYIENNASLEEWVWDHEARYGPAGENIDIHTFDIRESFPVDDDTFPGNFSAIQAVTVDTVVSYLGTASNSTTQFAVVKTGNGWKLYGPY